MRAAVRPREQHHEGRIFSIIEVTMTTPPPAQPEYVCPMHAQIVRDAQGACPLCGMALQRHTAAAE